MSTATFRFSTDILQRLGEELITSFDQGVIELVKNSYDADASVCSIELIDTQQAGGTVVITDDGDGMSIQDIQDGWLVLGRSRKVPGSRTRRDRLPAGSKGLGRLGALRMGQEVLLTTQPSMNRVWTTHSRYGGPTLRAVMSWRMWGSPCNARSLSGDPERASPFAA